MTKISPSTRNIQKLLFWLLLGAAFFGFLFLIHSILLPFVVGGMVAYFLDPAADWLETKKCSRLTATSLLTIAFFGGLTLVIVGLAPLLYNQFTDLMSALPGYVERLRGTVQPYVNEMMSAISDNRRADTQEALTGATAPVFDVAKKFVAGIFVSSMAFVNLMTLIFLTPVVAFYLLRDWDGIVAHVDSLLPRESAPVIREQLREIDRTIAGYLRGQVNVCLILAVYYAAGLSFAGLKYGLLVGIMTGVITFIPFVGALVGTFTAVTIALFQFDNYTQVALVGGIFALGQLLEGNILIPKLIGGKVGLHPAWVIFGMLAGGAILGFVGVLLAVPITAIIGVLVRFGTSRYLESVLYRDGRLPERRTVAASVPAPKKKAPVKPRRKRPA